MVKAYVSLVFALLFLGASSSVGFEPYDYRAVPYPESTDQGIEPQLTDLVEVLTDVASQEYIPAANRAWLLAAARCISPLHKRAFETEYLFSIGAEPFSDKIIKTSEIASLVQPRLEIFESVIDSKGFTDFVNSALDIDFDAIQKSPEVTPILISKNTCGLLSMDGCIEISSHSETIRGTKFMFSPGKLQSPIFLSAYRESLKFLALNSSDGLVGKRINFEANQDLEDDEGPAAALACAVMTEALAKGLELDPRTAFCGDVNADGTVQPLEDQRERLEANQDTLATVIVIPNKDKFGTDDLLILSGAAIFSKTQIIGVDTLSEAVELGKKKKSSELIKALNTFAQVQQVLNKPGGGKYLKNSHVQKRLASVLELYPNHISAQQLSRVSKGNYPRTLSLDSSFELIFDALQPVFMGKKEREINAHGRLDPESLKRLTRFRKNIDPVLKPLSDAAFSFESNGRLGAGSGNGRARVKQRLKEELNALSRNVKIREKMM